MQFRYQYAFLSNMYSCPVFYQGEKYPCAETAFQIAKCANPSDEDLFLNNRGFYVNGFTARNIGRKVKLRSDWEKEKPWIMLEIIRSKFENPVLREALLKTGNENLVEDNDWGDTYWGVCNGKGKNMLGRILMYVRNEIKNNALNND